MPDRYDSTYKIIKETFEETMPPSPFHSSMLSKSNLLKYKLVHSITMTLVFVVVERNL